MSKYTTEVRYICEKAAGYDESKGYSDVDKIIEDAIPSVFNFPFPIFDDAYHDVLCTKILRHYYTREIGYETVGLWKLKLQTMLNEIMPYYNQLYKSELLKFNPLYDTDLNTTHVGNKDSEQTSEENKSGFSSTNNNKSETGSVDRTGSIVEGENRSGNSSNDEMTSVVSSDKNSKSGSNSETGADNSEKVNGKNFTESESKLHYDLYSDTPQGALTGVDEEEYLTNARKVTDTNGRNGKNDETEVGNSAYNKSGSLSETGESESNSAGASNSRNRFDETGSKTSVNNDNTVDSRNVTGSSNSSDYANRTENDKFNSTESYVLHVVGKQSGVSYSRLLKEFRETFLNIDMDIINALSGLFMNLW